MNATHPLLARVGAILAVVAVFIFAIGLVATMTPAASSLPAIIAGGAGLALVVAAAYLVLASRRGEPWNEVAEASVAVLRRAALITGLALIGAIIASLALRRTTSALPAIIFGLVGLQAPVALVMAAGYIAKARP
ncbi:hypothetical protein [Trueperella bialowiezensis]|uniref:Uncharacterized protein n=1 Tax=Trueperella bialowiezensis TaxID=312285 RepID=A0A3S4Z5X6_9ACTO|nr:hypothetical protein [Trueperella bialowiezensis]VEI13676.1 Uncharacterised protein [Trueperella bialowiezensis]